MHVFGKIFLFVADERCHAFKKVWFEYMDFLVFRTLTVWISRTWDCLDVIHISEKNTDWKKMCLLLDWFLEMYEMSGEKGETLSNLALISFQMSPTFYRFQVLLCVNNVPMLWNRNVLYYSKNKTKTVYSRWKNQIVFVKKELLVYLSLHLVLVCRRDAMVLLLEGNLWI